jgi:iron(III) transport system ATP-binding protein
MSELIVEGVEKWLGALQVLKGTSFTAERGAIVALLGSSGSGKTTLLRCIAGLERPEVGRIAIGGRAVLDAEKKIALPPEQRNIGMVFQSYALWPHRTVMENVAYGLKLRGVSKADTEKRVRASLHHIGLGHLADRYPSQLSGGQQQRVSICRALVYEPQVLLLDEPLSNLDAKIREEARYWIRKLILDLEICAVLVTHDQSEALAAADDILLLKDGRIIQSGSPETIYSNPNSFYCADFLGTNNIVSGRILARDGDTVEIGGEDWSLSATARETGLKVNQDVKAIIRAEEISILDAKVPGAIEVELLESAYLGNRWEHRFQRGDLIAKTHGSHRLETGKTWVRVPPRSVWVFANERGEQ